MAPRSPSLSFEPSPAILEDKENFPPLDETTGINSADYMDEKFRGPKEVHFSSAEPLARRAQSLASTVPMLEPISSASQLPRQNYHTRSTTSSIDVEAYMEHSRSLIHEQSLNFDRERKLFQNERRLWDKERAMLKSKIADLELASNKKRGEKRRYSNDSTRSSAQSFQSDLGQFSAFSSINGSRVSSKDNSTPPVWEGPESVAPASRVFPDSTIASANSFKDDHSKQSSGHHLPSISEDGNFPVPNRDVSPSSKPIQRTASIPIRGESIDSNLDGITLRSTALTNSFIPRVMTPQAITPSRSPSPNPKSHNDNRLRVGMGGLLSPLDEKLRLHAGHTPMAWLTKDSTGETTGQTTEIPSPTTDKPLAPYQTLNRPPARPSENKDSYFSDVGAEDETLAKFDEGDEKENEDPELKGPLNLSHHNETGQSDAFLNTLDAKLMTEAKRYVKSPDFDQSVEENQKDQSGPPEGAQDDEGPKLRIKRSMNFGSAFGSNRCGNI